MKIESLSYKLSFNSRIAIVGLFSVATNLLIGCKKDEIPPPDPPVSSIDTLEANELDFLNYWFFGKESYWIYYEDSLDYRDTVRIEYIDIHPDSNLGSGNEHETDGTFYIQGLSHTLVEVFGYSTSETRSGGYRVNYKDWVIFNGFEPQLYSPFVYDNFIVFGYPFNVGDTLYANAHVSDVLTLTTPAGIFENTVLMKTQVHTWYAIENDYTTELYFTPGVGVTRMKTGKGFDLQLEEYYIDQ